MDGERALGRAEIIAMGLNPDEYEKTHSSPKIVHKKIKVKIDKPKIVLKKIKVRTDKDDIGLSEEKTSSSEKDKPNIFDINKYTFRGKGSYGCVLSPTIPCKDKEINKIVKKGIKNGKKYVSKVFNFNVKMEEIDNFIFANKIANEAGNNANKKGYTKDMGIEMWKCDLPEIYILDKKCGRSFDESHNSLILEDLGKNNLENLDDELLEKLKKLTINQLKRMIESNIVNLEELHKLSYVHSDIKTENMILNLNEPNSIKIIDFDLIKKLDLDTPTILKYYNRFKYFYFFPPEYYYIGAIFYNREEKTYSEILLDHYYIIKQNYPNTFKKIAELVRKKGESYSKGLDKIGEENEKIVDEIYDLMVDTTEKTDKNYNKIFRLWVSLDYYMWAISIYELISSILEVEKDETKKKEMEKILEGLEKYFHPELLKRKINNDINVI